MTPQYSVLVTLPPRPSMTPLKLRGQFLDLLRAEHPGAQDRRVRRAAWMPFPCLSCSPRRQAPRALRERLECSEGGNTGRRTMWPYRPHANMSTAVRSAPGRDRAEARGYTQFATKGKRTGTVGRLTSRRVGRPALDGVAAAGRRAARRASTPSRIWRARGAARRCGLRSLLAARRASVRGLLASKLLPERRIAGARAPDRHR